MKRTALVASGVLFVLSTLAVVVHEPSSDGSTLTLGDGGSGDVEYTPVPADEPTTTTTAEVTTTTAPSPATTTTAAPRATTTTTLAPIRYPTGPADAVRMGAVYLVRPDEGVAREVIFHYGLDQPAWSADGRRVLVVSDKIVSVNPDGSSPKEHSLPGAIVTPAWSSRGQLAAVTIEYPAQAYNLGVTVGSKVKTIRQDQVGPVSGRAWSPDGGRVAFTAGGRLWVANADTTGVKALTGSETKAFVWLSWSPDGSKIAFYGDGALWVVGADGSGLRRLAPMAGRATWSPDGSRLVFAGPQSPEFPLQSVGVADGVVVKLGPTGMGNPVYSPDGRSIVLADRFSVWVMNADGGGVRKLVTIGEDTWFGFGLAWSPDGTHVMFNTGGAGEGGPGEPR